MNTGNVLDWSVLHALGLFPEKGEEVYWAGAPGQMPQIPGVTAFESGWLVYYVILIQLIRVAIRTEGPELWILLGTVVFVVQVLPALIKFSRRYGIFYVITNKRIIIRYRRFFAKKIHILRYDDLLATSYTTYESDNSKGTVYLITTKDVGFWTYDLESGDRRDHPSMEDIAQPRQLAEQIERFRLEYGK